MQKSLMTLWTKLLKGHQRKNRRGTSKSDASIEIRSKKPRQLNWEDGKIMAFIKSEVR